MTHAAGKAEKRVILIQALRFEAVFRAGMTEPRAFRARQSQAPRVQENFR